MDPWPILLHPLLKPKVWGGRTLARLGHALPDDVLIGESWEVADLPRSVPEGRSVIANGPAAGRSLRDLVTAHADWLLGAAAPSDDGGFPLLVKYLDAQQSLSVQVHPSPAYAAAHPEAHLKSEAWYVVDAVPGASIFAGLRPGVDAASLRAHLERGTVLEALETIPARPGDCHYLPSGTCHAVGAGMLIAEVQTPSDTTFRLYDWGRTGRAMHLEAGLACVDFDRTGPIRAQEIHAAVDRADIARTMRLETEHFGIERLEVTGGATVPIVTNGLPQVWMILAGHGRASTGAAPPVDLPRGRTVILPAALRTATFEAVEAVIALRITLPSPLRGRIARD